MALFFYGGRRRYSRFKSRRSYRRAFSSYSRSQRRATRNQKAAIQQRDQGEVVINIPTKIEVFNGETEIGFIDAEHQDQDEPVISTFNNGGYALNIWELLRKSEFYQSYANMYDQVKLDKVTVKLTPYQFPIVNYGNSVGIKQYYNSYTIVTAWDRTGLSNEQMVYIHSQGGTESKKEWKVGNRNNEDGLYPQLSGKSIATYSSAIQRNINPNSSTASITRTLYPTTIGEKSYWVNTGDLRNWYDGFDAEHGRYYGITPQTAIQSRSLTIEAQQMVIPQYPLTAVGAVTRMQATNPCYLLETAEVPFKPTLLIGMLNEEIDLSAEGQNWGKLTPRMKFNVECDCVVTFRGLRKASIVE